MEKIYRKSVLTTLGVLIVLLCSCEKEGFNSSSVMTIRNVTHNSVDVSATYFSSGEETSFERGFKYKGGQYTFFVTHVADGQSNGSVNATITDLDPDTEYTIYSYVYNGSVYPSEEQTFTTSPPPLEVGSIGPGGGFVFYVDGQGGGMEALPVSWTTDWGCQDTLISGLDTTFGSGANNTSLIINQCSQQQCAARFCDTCTAGGFTDWYLPSLAELRSVYVNIDLGGYYNYNGQYFSSNDASLSMASGIDFGNGNTLDNMIKIMPGYSLFPIREF